MKIASTVAVTPLLRRHQWPRLALPVLVLLLVWSVYYSLGHAAPLGLPFDSATITADHTIKNENENGYCMTHQRPIESLFSAMGTVGTGSCSYSYSQIRPPSMSMSSMSMSSSSMSQAQAQAKIKQATIDWGYPAKVKGLAKKVGVDYHGMRLLDVGMGQGPWGAAFLQAGVDYYVGLDPAVCPPVQAKTRDLTKGRTGTSRQCHKAFDVSNSSSTTTTTTSRTGETSLVDPRIEECKGGTAKYRAFEMSGLDMMAAYPQRLALLPGTFETLQDSNIPLDRLVFDVVLLKTVTEHLQQLQPVMEGLWKILGPCSHDSATIVLDHHNYYSYSGHHGFPKGAADFTKDDTVPEYMMELADWGHIHPDSSEADKESLNRVRPGDLQALLNVYFKCECRHVPVKTAERNRLTEEHKQDLLDKGYAMGELFLDHLFFQCKRRSEQLPELSPEVLLYHPPMDGSYHPNKLSCPISIETSPF